MKLEVMSISFLRSGALSVEVGAQSQKDAPAEPTLGIAVTTSIAARPRVHDIVRLPSEVR